MDFKAATARIGLASRLLDAAEASAGRPGRGGWVAGAAAALQQAKPMVPNGQSREALSRADQSMQADYEEEVGRLRALRAGTR